MRTVGRALKTIVSIAGAVLGLCLPAVSQVAKTPQGYVLQAAYRSNEVLKFEAETDIGGLTNDDRSVGITFGVTLKVLKQKRGTTTLSIDLGRASTASFPLKFKHSQATVDVHNHVVDSNKSVQAIAYFPDHPVKLNESWSGYASIPLGGQSSGGLVKTTYKLTRVAVDHGKLIAELSLSMRGYAKGNGTVLVNAKDGSLLSSAMYLELRATEKNNRYKIRLLMKRLS